MGRSAPRVLAGMALVAGALLVLPAGGATYADCLADYGAYSVEPAVVAKGGRLDVLVEVVDRNPLPGIPGFDGVRLEVEGRYVDGSEAFGTELPVQDVPTAFQAAFLLSRHAPAGEGTIHFELLEDTTSVTSCFIYELDQVLTFSVAR